MLTLPRALPLRDERTGKEVAVLLADARAPPAFVGPGLVKAIRAGTAGSSE